jgi:hypothetical protein
MFCATIPDHSAGWHRIVNPEIMLSGVNSSQAGESR